MGKNSFIELYLEKLLTTCILVLILKDGHINIFLFETSMEWQEELDFYYFFSHQKK